MKDFEEWWNTKLKDKDFTFSMACQHEWTDEEFKKLFENCWNMAQNEYKKFIIEFVKQGMSKEL